MAEHENDSPTDSSTRREAPSRPTRRAAPARQTHAHGTGKHHSRTAGTHGQGQPTVKKAYYISSAVYGQGGETGQHALSEKGGHGRRGNGRRRSGKAPALIALVLLVAIIGGGAYLWAHRPVKLTLNGNQIEAQPGESLEKLKDDNKIQVAAGNYVSVLGNVIREGGGTPFSAKVDGEDLSAENVGAYGVRGGETIEIGDGSDTTEDYDATTSEVQPKLVMEGGYGAFAYIKQWGKVGITETRTGRDSGETAEVTVQEVQNCTVFLHNFTPDNGQKLVALTFDDGPSEFTQQYLDILAQYGAKATFFQLGNNIREYPDLAKAVADAGMQVASHSDTHPELTKLDAAALRKELGDSLDSLKDATGVSTTIFRPPYGAFKESTWLNSGGLVSASVLWNQDSEDWRRPGVDAIVANSLRGITNGSIILMHDGGGDRSQDVQALPTIISSLQSQGYTLVTLNELMAADSSIPDDIKTGNATMPAEAVWPTELGDN